MVKSLNIEMLNIWSSRGIGRKIEFKRNNGKEFFKTEKIIN